MKKILLTIAIASICTYSYAQSIFPTDGSYVGIGTTSPTRLLDIVSGTGVGPLKVSGPNGSLLIDNVGSGQSYYQANAFHQFQGPSGNAVMTILGTGYVGIGTTTPREALSVNGNIRSQQVKVETANWPDYVFKKEYQLPSLLEVKNYIDQNHHLPDMPSEQDIKDNGLNLGEINKILTKKVEELTLYLIEKDKQVTEQQKQINELKEQVNAIIQNTKTQSPK